MTSARAARRWCACRPAARAGRSSRTSLRSQGCSAVVLEARRPRGPTSAASMGARVALPGGRAEVAPSMAVRRAAPVPRRRRGRPGRGSRTTHRRRTAPGPGGLLQVEVLQIDAGLEDRPVQIGLPGPGPPDTGLAEVVRQIGEVRRRHGVVDDPGHARPAGLSAIACVDVRRLVGVQVGRDQVRRVTALHRRRRGRPSRRDPTALASSHMVSLQNTPPVRSCRGHR